ncbi:MAG: HAD-IC family P-type ATPase [Gammaproteobacteria bacterium]|nr:HAD-IC family P-type ATPase [Gammaproteobacteria bacterium]
MPDNPNKQASADIPTPPDTPYQLSIADTFSALGVDRHGLTAQQAQQRQDAYGYNRLPQAKTTSLLQIALRQFLNPLIYILSFAAIISLVVGEHTDAIFIGLVLTLNSVIGAVQEYSAEQSAAALQKLVTHYTRTIRDGRICELQASELVPGDIVLLASGDKVPADLRLIATQNLTVDESLLTGESLAVQQNAESVVDVDATMGDRVNMAYAGTLVVRGRATGVVTATGRFTELGRIAEAVLTGRSVKPPLMIRMDQFSIRISFVMVFMVLILGAIALSRGMPLTEILLMSAALAVSVIPEGLPVAMTIALSISMRRMAKREVIVRKLVTVEALGSCTYIATDKTGTLTVNKITVEKLLMPDGRLFDVNGEGITIHGKTTNPSEGLSNFEEDWLSRLSRTAVLANEATIDKHEGKWVHQGDAVDVALLIMAHKLNVMRPDVLAECPEQSIIPYESASQFSASLNRCKDGSQIFVKGAMEKIISMCTTMTTADGDVPISPQQIEKQANILANQGYRLLSLASGVNNVGGDKKLSSSHLSGLNFLGLVGMIDPLRDEVPKAIAACRTAGIKIGMITGDHPATALAIARELGLAQTPEQVITGKDVKAVEEQPNQYIDALTQRGCIFARVEPYQKLHIVQSLERNGHFVAVTGDGANDAPALRAAHVGVAMGKGGADVARETSDMILVDDNFASIVSGVEEGRIAYANVRKVILLLLATGASELVLVSLSIITGLPLPLTAVQLLWLNLVTNGIQDVALAFEPGEGNELRRPPRDPKEPIFNRLMVEKILLVAAVIAVVAFLAFEWMLDQGYSVEEARNGVLLLMVLYENVYVFNCRSETRSVFTQNPLRNPFLLYGTLAAQLIHIGAMYTPGLRDILDIQPVSLSTWVTLLLLACAALLASEFHKFIWHWRIKKRIISA